MKVLGILGSPRRGGNTETLLDRALEGAESGGAETEKLVLRELNIAPCEGRDDCSLTGECTIQDDIQEVYPKLRAADGLILASPLYFLGLTAQTKAMIDRCESLWMAKYRLHRPVSLKGSRRKGLFISTAGRASLKGFQGAIMVVRSFFATLEIAYEGELLFTKIDERGDILKHPTACQEAFDAGFKLARGE